MNIRYVIEQVARGEISIGFAAEKLNMSLLEFRNESKKYKDLIEQIQRKQEKDISMDEG